MASCLLAIAACSDWPTGPSPGADGGGRAGEDARGGGATGGVQCAGSDLVCPGGAWCQLDTEGRPSGCAAACDGAHVCGEHTCCSPGATCIHGGCYAADLVLEPLRGKEPVTIDWITVGEDACEVTYGCVGGSGRRAVLRFRVSLRNAGEAPLDLGAPAESDVFAPNFCEQSYVVPRFFRAVLRRGDVVVASADLDARCVAAPGGQYGCDAQGLRPGEHVAQPGTTSCNALDVTGLPAGRYELALTVNPDRTVAESRFANNTISFPVDYPACDGTICSGACCPSGHTCLDGVCLLPDLRPSRQRIVDTLHVGYETFPADACELLEGCVGGPGRRRLLRFEGRVENAGPGHLDAGPEIDNPLFEFAQCHQHFHLKDFTEYQLVGADGAIVAQGHKQAFCLVDMAALDPGSPAPQGAPSAGGTGCNFLSAGWADIYDVETPCQWVDVTDVPEGDYVLRVAVNPAGVLAERSLEDNVVEVPVHVPAPSACVPEPERCGDLIDQDCDGRLDNGCDEVCPAPSTELCGNGLDENCNGIPDDGCTPAPGAGRCATPAELTGSMDYAADIAPESTAEVRLPCGGEGGAAFFRFTLPSEEVVYLGTLESQLDTVIAVLEGDGCAGRLVGCATDSCGDLVPGASFAARLPAGTYTAVVQAASPGASGRVRLKFQRASCLGEGAEVIAESGLFRGDTTGASIPPRSACGASSPAQTHYVALCPERPVRVSSCGLTDFPMTIKIASDACTPVRYTCSDPLEACAGDPEGASAALRGGAPGGGLGSITVSGRTPVDSGPYQLFVVHH